MSVDPSLYPPFIFGLHDPPKAHKNPMLQKNRLGWVVITEGIGDDPNGPPGPDYRYLSDKGLGVIVRLNYGYGLDECARAVEMIDADALVWHLNQEGKVDLSGSPIIGSYPD